MGSISKHGTSPGSLVPVVVIGPISVPPGQVHIIEDFKTEMEAGAANGAFVIEKSNDNFGVNNVEVDRTEMPVPGTFEDSPVTATTINGGPAVQWRVRLVQSMVGAASATIRGETQDAAGNPKGAPDILD